MNYAAAVSSLYDANTGEIQPGTDVVASVIDALGVEADGVDFVQVTGSNGKGSTARITSAILQAAGYDVGLFTSPHVDDFRERVRINGQKVSKQAVRSFVETCSATEFGTPREPTYFEMLTALAVREFAARDVDIGVVEVGVGGRRDPTSVVDPSVSALTNVSLEHTEFLGETIPEIAAEKSAIAPDEGPLVTACSGDALDTARAHADEVRTVGDETADVSTEVSFDGGRTQRLSLQLPESSVTTDLPLLGDFQRLNAGVAAGVALEFERVDTSAIADGIQSVRWPGRMEVVSREPRVLLDMAQNPGSAEKLGELLREFDYRDLHVVYGCVEVDEESMGRTVETLPDAETVHTCSPMLDAMAPADTLTELFAAYGYEDVTGVEATTDAVTAAMEVASPDDLVLVTGSLYTVCEARRVWSRAATVRPPTRTEFRRRADIDRQSRDETAEFAVRLRANPPEVESIETISDELSATISVPSIRVVEEPTNFVVDGTPAELRAAATRLEASPKGLGYLGRILRQTVDDVLSTTADPATQLRYVPVTGVDDLDDISLSADTPSRGISLDISTAPVDLSAFESSLSDLLGRVPSETTVCVETGVSAVAETAVEARVDRLRDLSGRLDPAVARAVATAGTELVVTANPTEPEQAVIPSEDCVQETAATLIEEAIFAESFGIPSEDIFLSPGIGVRNDSTTAGRLLSRVGELSGLSYPLFVGGRGLSWGDSESVPLADRPRVVRGADVIVE